MSVIYKPSQKETWDSEPSREPASQPTSPWLETPVRRDEHVKRLFSDTGYFDRYVRELRFPGPESLSLVSEESAKAGANRAYFAFVTDRKPEEIDDYEHSLWRDGFVGYATDRAPHPVGDSLAFDTITRRYRLDEATEKSLAALAESLDIATVSQTLSDSPATEYQEYLKWRESLPPEFSSEIAEKVSFEGMLHRSTELRRQVTALREPIQQVESTLTAYMESRSDFNDLRDLAVTLNRDYTEEQRQLIFSAVGLSAKGKNVNLKTFGQLADNLGKVTGRSFWFMDKLLLLSGQFQNLEKEEVLNASQVWLNGSEATLENVYRPQSAVSTGVSNSAGMPSGMGPHISGFDPHGRHATPEEITHLRAELVKDKAVMSLIRNLRRMGETEVSPMIPLTEEGTPLAILESASYSVAGSTGTLVATAIHPLAGIAVSSVDAMDRILTENPRMNPRAAAAMGVFEGVVSTMIERAQLKALPKGGEIVRQTWRTGKWSEGAWEGAVYLGGQYGQEQLQAAIAPVTETFVSRLRDDMSEKELVQEILNYASQMPENLAATLIVAVVGGGLISTKNLMISRRQIIAGLERHGVSGEQLSRVGKADDDGLDAAIAQVIQELTPEQKAEAAARIRQEFLKSGLPAEGLNITIGKSEGDGRMVTKYEVRRPDGSVSLRRLYKEDGQDAENGSVIHIGNKKADGLGVKPVRKGIEPIQLGNAAFELAEHDSVFRLGPTPTARDFPTILRTLAPEISEDIKISNDAGWHGEGFTFTDSAGGEIFLTTHPEGGYRVDSSKAGPDSTAIYQGIYAWAHNNGVQVHEDLGMSPVGVYRRNSQMISSIMRFKTSRHLTVGPASGMSAQWIRDDGSRTAAAHNLGLLLQREKEVVFGRLPGLKELRYDLEDNTVYDGEHRIAREETEALIGERIAGMDSTVSARVGSSTARRVLGVAAAEEGGSGWRSWLVGDVPGAVRSFEGAFYSKNSGRSPEDALRGQGSERREPEGVPGEAGRGGSSQRLGAEEQGARTRAWVGEIQSGWGSKLDVVVHESAESIGDVRLREAVAEGGANVEAFYDAQDGRIHLLADRVGSKADAERVLRHEGIHWAINGKLNKEYDSILEGVRKLISDTEWEKIIKDYPDASDRVRVEEYLAYRGQDNRKSKTWEKFAYEVKRMLKEFFGKDFEVTDADVQAFLTKANRELEGGRTKTHAGRDTYFSSERPTLDENGRLRFSKETTASLKKLISQFQTEIDNKVLTPEQQGIANVMSDRQKSATIKRSDLGILSELVTLERGHYRYGAKHILVDHYSGKRGYVTAAEIVEMGRVIREGTMSVKDGKRIYEWRDADQVRFRVIVSEKQETVITFYSNRK